VLLVKGQTLVTQSATGDLDVMRGRGLVLKEPDSHAAAFAQREGGIVRCDGLSFPGSASPTPVQSG
jgi:hypothetical protein